MSSAIDPLPYAWWLVSRASGTLALALVSLAVLLGLGMATRTLGRGRSKGRLLRLHEHIALLGLAAIALHGLSLLGDRWLHPGLTGIALPFAMSYRPAFTGLGILAGYLAAILGLSFYVRRRIGARTWRKLHRLTTLVWALGVVHTLGAGSDATTLPMRAFLLATGVPIAALAALRVWRSLTTGTPSARRGAQADSTDRPSLTPKYRRPTTSP